MKKNMMKVGKVVADAALTVTKANVNSICAVILFQPKLPKGYEKLKK